MGEGETCTERHLGTDDAVAAIEGVLGAEHVHGTALAAADPRFAPGQLGHDHLRVDAIGEHVAVVAIAGDDAVLALFQSALQAHGHGFLADIEVAKAADQAHAVKLTCLFLETANEQHLLIEGEQLLLACLVALVLLQLLLQAVENEALIVMRCLGSAL